jgi:hypothetical protein
VAHRVVGQVHHRLGQSLAVGHDNAEPGAGQAPVAIPGRSALGKQVGGQQVEIDRLGTQEIGTLRPGQQQQVLDNARHAVELVEHHRAGGPPLLGVIALELDVAPDDGDGRAQLVAGIVKEAALVAERCLETVEHGVERARQLGDLVVAASHVDAPAQVGLRQLLGRLGHRPHGRQHPARDQPPQRPRDQQDRAVHDRAHPDVRLDIGTSLV